MPRQDARPLLLDRCVSLILATLEVGSHNQRLYAKTGVPRAVVSNASWFLRYAKIWPPNGQGRNVNYPWLADFRRGLEAGSDGLMRTAAVAAGIIEMDGSPTIRSQLLGHSFSNAPSCGTSLGLSYHHLLGETCGTCEAAAELRHIAREERMALRRARVRQKRATRIVAAQQDARISYERYQEFLEQEAREAYWRRVDHQKELAQLKQVGLKIRRPTMISLDYHGPNADRLEPGIDWHERIGLNPRDQPASHFEWYDPTFEAVAQTLEQHLHRDRAAQDYQQLVTIAAQPPTDPVPFVDQRGLEARLGRSLREYWGPIDWNENRITRWR